MSLTTKNLTNINKVASEVHRKYVAGTHVGECVNEEVSKSRFSKEDVENIVCLYIYGVYGSKMENYFDESSNYLCQLSRRGFCRKLKLSFQKSKKKIRGKMVFEYDKEKVIKHFKNMPKELQSLSNGILFEERLVNVTKILKSEMY